MKMLSILALAMIVAASSFAREKKSNTPQNESTPLISQTSAAIDTVPPASIKTSFTTRYPNASNVKWYSFTPATTIEPGMWYSTLGPDDYYVSFIMDDADYIAWYDNGNWIYSTQRIDDTELPAAVSSAINSEYPGFVITDVDREHDAKQMLYEVKLQKGNQRWNIHYTPAGTVFKKKQRDLTPVQAETAMTNDFNTRYAGASDVVWYRYDPADRIEVLPGDWNYNMDANDYEVVYMLDGSPYVAYYDNGNWIHSESNMFDRNKLPLAVSNAINTQYAGYTIKDVSREDSRDQVVYEVELTKGSDKCKIHYTAEGSVAKKKCKIGGVKTKS
jgi:uncharacterized membrane protein YkoI